MGIEVIVKTPFCDSWRETLVQKLTNLWRKNNQPTNSYWEEISQPLGNHPLLGRN